MPVLEGYENADTPHAKTVMAPGWTYGCHSSKVGITGWTKCIPFPRRTRQLNEARFSSIHRGLSTVAQKVQRQALLKEMS